MTGSLSLHHVKQISVLAIDSSEGTIWRKIIIKRENGEKFDITLFPFNTNDNLAVDYEGVAL